MKGLNERLDSALEIVRKVGEFLVDNQFKISEVRYKTSVFDLVTDIDLKSQEIIIEHLKGAFPNDVFVAEEGYSSEFPDHGWFIDPIDGTANFIHGLPIFAISIAYVLDGEPVIGVAGIPRLDSIYFAMKGEGSFKIEKGTERKINVSETVDLLKAFVGTNYSSKGKENLVRIEKLMGRVRRLRIFGSSVYSMVCVAEGLLDAFWADYLKPWDSAAGFLMVKEAGGKVENLDGDPGDFKDEKLLFSNGKIDSELLKIFEDQGGCSN